MRLGLAMIVRDERARLPACLGGVVERVDAVSVIDTGSTDGTVAWLREAHGIVAAHQRFDPHVDRYDDLRNAAASRLDTEWILHLDADERLAPDAIDALRARLDGPEQAWMLRWRNHVRGERFDDYKGAVVRRGVPYRGRVHEQVQVALRDAGQRAGWALDLCLEHRPAPERDPQKRAAYDAAMRRGLVEDPAWHRYRWFLGYRAWLDGDAAAAARWLAPVVDAAPDRFPVETLQACAVLAAAEQRLGGAPEPVLRTARALRARWAADFEVAGNPFIDGWLHAAEADAPPPPPPPRFAC